MPVASAEAEPAFDAPPPVEHVVAEVAAPFADGTNPFAIEEEHAPAAPVHEESPPPFTAESDPFAAAPAHEDAPRPSRRRPIFSPSLSPRRSNKRPRRASNPIRSPSNRLPVPPQPEQNSYLSAARRSARAAAAQVESQVDRGGGGFAWAQPLLKKTQRPSLAPGGPTSSSASSRLSSSWPSSPEPFSASASAQRLRILPVRCSTRLNPSPSLRTRPLSNPRRSSRPPRTHPRS